jgi:ABC-2 type transport system ATP-binding protein
MLLTSHYMEDIERLCQRIVIIRGGEIVYDGGLREVLDHYAPHKRLTVRWEATEFGGALPENVLPPALGEITSVEPGVLHAKVPRAKTAEAASWLLQKLPVADLNLEEEDVGSIIEALIRRPV